MFYKKLNLMLLQVLLIVLFFCIPLYNGWLHTKLLGNSFIGEIDHMDLNSRNIMRFGYSYTVYQDIQRVLRDQKDVTLLLPTNQYIESRKIQDLNIPEPAVFYYFTGIKAVWPNSPDANLATWVFLAKGPRQMNVKKMSLVGNPDSLLADYKKYIK